jgi:predicted Zn-dependent protease with MMP-like domain
VAYRVSKAQFARFVEEAAEELPPQFAELVEEVPIEIHDAPTPELLAEVGVPKGSTLRGLYRGRPRPRRHIEDSGAMPDVILIFQNTIEAVCADEEQLKRQVRTTVLHEIGHHFGLDEDDLERLGYR